MAATPDDTTNGDPFERALARERAYLERRSRSEVLAFPGIIRWIALAFLLAWGGLLALHWTVFGDPRWLAVLHTMVYGVMCLYVIAAILFVTFIGKKPAAFGLVSEDD